MAGREPSFLDCHGIAKPASCPRMPSPFIRCKVCGHKMHERAPRCPFCGKVYRQSTVIYLLVVILVLAGIALLVFSFSQGRQQTRASQRELEEAAKEAGLR